MVEEKRNQQLQKASQLYLEAKAVIAQLERLTKTQAISFKQFLIMDYLMANPGCKQNEIVAFLGMSRATMNRESDALYQKGYLHKQRDQIEQDQRVVRLGLTATGRLVYQNTLQQIAQAELDTMEINIR